MFKLKIIDKPEMFKMKCNFEFPKIPIENLQEKEVNPTTEKQEIVADKEYSALSKVMINAVTSDIDSNIQAYNIKKDVSILGVTGNVIELNGEERTTTPTKNTQIITPSADKNAITKMTINPIPDEYIIPSGEIEIIGNGNYDVTDKVNAKVNVPTKILGTKTITKNGVYNATDDNLDGYSQVEVETSGVDINDYYNFEKRTFGAITYYIKTIPLIDTSSYTNMEGLFRYYTSLESIPLLDTRNVKTMMNMCGNCGNLKSFPQFDTSKVTNFYNMCSWCLSLKELPRLDFSSAQAIRNITYGAYRYIKLGGFKELGKGYETSKSANHTDYTLDISQGATISAPNSLFSTNIDHDSLMNVINDLYDIASKGVKTQQLTIGSTNLAKLTAEELAIGTSKGWSIS